MLCYPLLCSGCRCGLLSDSPPLDEKSKIDFCPTKLGLSNSIQKFWSWSEAPRFRILLSAMAAASSLMITPISSCGFGRQQILSRNQGNSAVRQRRIFSPGRQQASATLGSKFLCDLEQQRRLLRHGAGSRGGEVLRFQRKTGQARAGLPVVSGIPVLGPVLNAFLNPVVLFIIYAAGASRFWSGFGRTTYTNSASTKFALTALWPALFFASAAYRSNFKKAIR